MPRQGVFPDAPFFFPGHLGDPNFVSPLLRPGHSQDPNKTVLHKYHEDLVSRAVMQVIRELADETSDKAPKGWADLRERVLRAIERQYRAELMEPFEKVLVPDVEGVIMDFVGVPWCGDGMLPCLVHLNEKLQLMALDMVYNKAKKPYVHVYLNASGSEHLRTRCGPGGVILDCMLRECSQYPFSASQDVVPEELLTAFQSNFLYYALRNDEKCNKEGARLGIVRSSKNSRAALPSQAVRGTASAANRMQGNFSIVLYDPAQLWARLDCAAGIGRRVAAECIRGSLDTVEAIPTGDIVEEIGKAETGADDFKPWLPVMHDHEWLAMRPPAVESVSFWGADGDEVALRVTCRG